MYKKITLFVTIVLVSLVAVSQNKAFAMVSSTMDPLDQASKVTPTPIYGSVEVKVKPADAEIWLDGKLMGATPMLLTKVLAGEHKIEVRKSGYEELTESAVVKKNEKIVLIGELKEAAIAQATENHEWVDMGLSVKWATCNVGANAPEDYGDYFAWGETSPKNIYSWYNLKYSLWLENQIKFSKYVTIHNVGNESFRIEDYGPVDHKAVLEPEDDAARVNWGGSWRMPTKAEFEELIEKCTWTWTTLNGKNGYKIMSKVNGNSIFLPAAGLPGDTESNRAGSDGTYWSSSLSVSNPSFAFAFAFNHIPESGLYLNFILEGRNLITEHIHTNIFHRFEGHSVRPVCQVTDEPGNVQAINVPLQYSEDERINGVDLGLSVKWAICNLGASGPEESGRYFYWGDVKGQTWNGSWSEGGFSEPQGFEALRPRYKLSDNNLTPEYDGAYVNLGGKWRMPSAKEFGELLRYCNVVWTTVNGVYGILFTSKKPGYEDKSVFFPAVGLSFISKNVVNHGDIHGYNLGGSYWSRNLSSNYEDKSWGFGFDSGSREVFLSSDFTHYIGRSIRPVSEY